jgi:hypothetical protein
MSITRFKEGGSRLLIMNSSCVGFFNHKVQLRHLQHTHTHTPINTRMQTLPLCIGVAHLHLAIRQPHPTRHGTVTLARLGPSTIWCQNEPIHMPLGRREHGTKACLLCRADYIRVFVGRASSGQATFKLLHLLKNISYI